jgi:transcription elongation GreA/GreB family factor
MVSRKVLLIENYLYLKNLFGILNMEGLKEKIVSECKQQLVERKERLNVLITEMSESMTAETKSTVGDKHETARARMQSEQEKLQGQLSEISDQISKLEKIDVAVLHESIFTGTLIETNNGIFFIAVPLGKVTVSGREIMVISPLSPVGKLLMGLRKHDTFTLNGANYRVERFY